MGTNLPRKLQPMQLATVSFGKIVQVLKTAIAAVSNGHYVV